MARHVQRTGTVVEVEFLRGADGLDDILSHVIDSTKVIENPAGTGRYIVEPGEVMGKISGSSKIMPVRYGNFGTGSAGAWVQADIVGINETKIEFPSGVTFGSNTDMEAAVIHFNAHFNVSKLKGYTGRESIVQAALSHCKFS